MRRGVRRASPALAHPPTSVAGPASGEAGPGCARRSSATGASCTVRTADSGQQVLEDRIRAGVLRGRLREHLRAAPPTRRGPDLRKNLPRLAAYAPAPAAPVDLPGQRLQAYRVGAAPVRLRQRLCLPEARRHHAVRPQTVPEPADKEDQRERRQNRRGRGTRASHGCGWRGRCRWSDQKDSVPSGTEPQAVHLDEDRGSHLRHFRHIFIRIEIQGASFRFRIRSDPYSRCRPGDFHRWSRASLRTHLHR